MKTHSGRAAVKNFGSRVARRALEAHWASALPCPANTPSAGGKRRRGRLMRRRVLRAGPEPDCSLSGAPPCRAPRAGASCPPRSESIWIVRTRGSFWQKADEPGPARGLVGGLKEVKWRTWRTKVGEAPSGASWRPGDGRREVRGPQARGVSTPGAWGLSAPEERPSGPCSRPPLHPLRPGSPARPISPGSPGPFHRPARRPGRRRGPRS